MKWWGGIAVTGNKKKDWNKLHAYLKAKEKQAHTKREIRLVKKHRCNSSIKKKKTILQYFIAEHTEFVNYYYSIFHLVLFFLISIEKKNI